LSLVPLPDGLAPDAVEKLRWETFGHRRTQCLQSPEYQVRFTQQRGFVLLFPVIGLRYPSMLEATVGRPLLDFSWDERTRSMSAWHAQTLRSRKVGQSAVLAGQTCAVSPNYLAQFFRVSELPGELTDCDRLKELGNVGIDVVHVAKAIDEHGPLASAELAKKCAMGQAAALPRFTKAITEAQRHLLIVEVDSAEGDDGEPQAVYDLLPRAFPAVVKKSRNLSAQAAREHIVCRYLRNVLLDAAHEMARILGWPESVVVSTCEALRRKGHVQPHPTSRPNRHLFQATSTDLLPQAPEQSPA